MANLILFCGRPGNYKTYISSRLAAKLGYMYVPTAAFGGRMPSNASMLSSFRRARYETICEWLRQFNGVTCSIILDGGYADPEQRHQILALNWTSTTIISCVNDNEERRIERLLIRATDINDHESTTAKNIVDSYYAADTSANIGFSFPAEMPSSQLADNVLIFNADQLSITCGMSRTLDDAGKRVGRAVNDIISELRVHPLPESYQQAVRRHFDQMAFQYDGSTEWRKDSSILESMIRGFDLSNLKVLDVATGTGICGGYFKDRGHDVTGIDLSQSMLHIAKNRLHRAIVSDAHSLSFPSQTFDIVLMRQCLHYLDTVKALNEVRRVLLPGGTIVISCAYWPNRESLKLWQSFKSKTQPLRNKVITLPFLYDALGKSGFKPRSEHIHTIQIRNVHLASLENEWEPPLEGWKVFLREFSERMVIESPEMNARFDGEVFSYTQYWVTIHADK